MKDRRWDGCDGKMRNEMEAAIVCPQGNEGILETEKGSTRSHLVQNSLCKESVNLS